jgi:hypothetical protein
LPPAAQENQIATGEDRRALPGTVESAAYFTMCSVVYISKIYMDGKALSRRFNAFRARDALAVVREP